MNPSFDTLFDTEQLFRQWCDELIELDKECGSPNASSGVWEAAKRYCIGIVDSASPTIMFKRRCAEVQIDIENGKFDTDDYPSYSPDLYEYIVAIMSSMLLWSASKDVRSQLFWSNMLPPAGILNKRLIATFNHIKQLITQYDLTPDDYDYTKPSVSMLEEKAREEDVAVMLQRTNEVMPLPPEERAAQSLTAEPKETTAPTEELTTIAIESHDKVRLELVARLLEEAGADFGKYGAKAEAARLANYITDIPLQTCRNYMSHRDLNTTEHNEEVLKTNTSLKKLNIDWQL